MSKTYIYNELSEKAKKKAVLDFIDATENKDITIKRVREIFAVLGSRFTEDGDRVIRYDAFC